MDRAKSREAAAFRRLRVRLTLLCTLATGLILIGVSLAALFVSASQLSTQRESAFQGSVNAIFDHLRSESTVDGTWVSQTEMSGDLTLYLELSGVPTLYSAGKSEDEKALIELASKKALQEKDLDLSKAPEIPLRVRQEFFQVRPAGGQRCRAAVGQILQDKGWLNIVVLQSMEAEEAQNALQRWSLAASVVLALGLLALFAWSFTGRLVRPIEENRRRQTEFIAAASHELRSPLAVVRASLAAIKDAPSEKAEHFTEMAVGECDRMSRLISDMLNLANADSGTWSMRLEELEPETLLLEVYEGFESLARAKGVAVEASLPEAPLPRCRWDAQRVTQLLSILVDNAVSYTPQGGRVRLSAALSGERVCLTVRDSGPGIPDAEKEKVFERFYRGDESRTDREHYGLGLSIAREIALLHRGSVAVTDAQGGGAEFVVTLPVRD